jgi:hypothetical protein
MCVLLLTKSAAVYAQDDQIEKTPYYVNFNDMPVNEITEVRESLLSFQYDDRYGQWKNIALKIYNWKRENVATVALAKTFGANYYNLKLDDYYTGWNLDETYTCEITNEAGKKMQMSIRPVAVPKKPEPNVGIIVNPLQLQCDGVSPASVEFVGDINGGKTPYTIQWAVLNNERTALLYQPLEEIIRVDGKTSVITVGKSPDYYVILEVKDACGNIVRKEVHMVCDMPTKKINTVFVEPILLTKPIN